MDNYDPDAAVHAATVRLARREDTYDYLFEQSDAEIVALCEARPAAQWAQAERMIALGIAEARGLQGNFPRLGQIPEYM